MVVGRPDTSLEGRGLAFAYGAQTVLGDVDLSLGPGQVLGVIGPNGSGKSTLLGLLSGLLAPTAGQVLLGGRELAAWPRRQVAALMGLVPQSPQMAPGFNVQETVLAGRYALMGRRLFDDDQDRQAASRALELTGLTSLAARPAGELSGGERQRLALARALAADPGVLLLDEPTSALDLDHQLRIMALLERLAQEEQRAICLVSHDLNLAGLYCSRLVLLSQGRTLAQGPPAQVLTPELLAQAYGVRTIVDTEPTRGRPRVTLVPR